MDTRWLRKTPDTEKEARKKLLKSYLPAYEELLSVLEKENESAPDYTNPAWAYQQADRNGANRILRDITKLIESIKD